MMNDRIMLPAELLAHWLGHRRLTRRVIEAFPEDQLFSFMPAPPMRSFGEMVWEIYGNTAYNLSGLINNAWGEPRWEVLPSTEKSALLAAWDAQTQRLTTELPKIPSARYGEVKSLAWGEMLALTAIIGAIDNEIHHRGQGIVYLRLLCIAPPEFWER